MACRDGDAFDRPFSMAFQPIVDVARGQVYAYEALVRGPAGEPAQTVLDHLTATNRYAFDQSSRVRAIRLALELGLLDTDARLSINFMPTAVYSVTACIQLTLKTARETGLPLDRLIFEFTEKEPMPAPEHVDAIVANYRKLGFGVAIDDFGSGHAGLGLLAEFKPDMVKLDIKLVRGIDGDDRRREIVKAIATMCSKLETQIIAEGVERIGEALALQELGIVLMQGYLFAQPGFERLPKVSRERLLL